MKVVKIVLMVIGGIVVFVGVLLFIIFTFVSSSSDKLICESKEGDITLMYNDKEIVGYTAKISLMIWINKKNMLKKLG